MGLYFKTETARTDEDGKPEFSRVSVDYFPNGAEVYIEILDVEADGARFDATGLFHIDAIQSLRDHLTAVLKAEGRE